MKPDPATGRAAGRRAAFTLLEILVAVAILGVVATTVAFVMGVGVEAWRAGAEMAEESHDGEGVMEQVVMALRSAYYPANGAPDWDFGFQLEDGGDGESAQDSISWVKIGNSLVGEDTPWAGAAHRVRLFVEDSPALSFVLCRLLSEYVVTPFLSVLSCSE